MFFGNYGFRKSIVANCLKRRVSEDPSTSNMVNGIKQCLNLSDTTFTRFVDRCEDN